MKDKLLKLPYEDLAIIINDYELANCYQPIYTNTTVNVSNLISEGKKIGKPLLNDFAFLTVNRYDVIEPIEDITNFINFEQELIPYIKSNHEKYPNLFPVEDASNEQIEVENMAINAYNKLTGKKLSKYSYLPETWHEILNPLILEHKYDEAKKAIWKMEHKNDPNKNLFRPKYAQDKPSEEDLNELVQEYFSCNYDDIEGLKKYGLSKYVDNVEDFSKVIQEAFKKYFEGKLTYDYIEDYLKNIWYDIEAYKKVSWRKATESEKKDLSERKETAKNIEADVLTYVDKFKSNPNSMAKFNKYYEPLKEKFLSGDFNKDEYENSLVILLKECMKGTYGNSTFVKVMKELKVSCPELNEHFKVINSDINSLSDSEIDKVQSVIILIQKLIKKSLEIKDVIVRGLQTIDKSEILSFLANQFGKNESELLEVIKGLIPNESEA